MAESLVHLIQENPIPTAFQKLKTIITSGKQLSYLIQDLLDFSELKHDGVLLHRKAVNLYPVVEWIFLLCASFKGSTVLQLKNEIPEQFGYVDADEERLHQILYNLVSNAMKFTEQGIIRVSAHSNGSWATITIADTGQGMPESHIQSILGGSKENRDSQASGMGLTLARHLIELHQGVISVQSIKNEGSTLSFTLPMSSSPLSYESESPSLSLMKLPLSLPENSTVLAKYRVLVIDDHPMDLRMIRQFLPESDYHVQQASQGHQALGLLEGASAPDLVLMDILLPDISSIALCHELRQRFPLDPFPILLLTTKRQTPEIPQLMDLGANDFLTKPFSKEELISRVKFHLELAITTKRFQSLQIFFEKNQFVYSKLKLFQETMEYLKHWVDHDEYYLFHEGVLIEEVSPNVRAKREVLLPKLNHSNQMVQIVHQVRSCSWESDPMGGTVLYLRWASLVGCLYRNHGRLPFLPSEIEYVKSFMISANLIRNNAHAHLFETQPKVMESLSQIRGHLDDVLYIMKTNPESTVVFKNQKEVLSFRLPLQSVNAFFAEGLFIQIHRSYLVNPQYAVRAVENKKYGHVLKLTRGELPIGNTYLSLLQKNQPQWFQ